MTSFWAPLPWLLRLWVLRLAITLGACATAAYGGNSQTELAYDGRPGFTKCYDAVFSLAKGEENNGTSENRVLFAKFAEFLGIKGVSITRN